jgi:hypothetical protein
MLEFWSDFATWEQALQHPEAWFSVEGWELVFQVGKELWYRDDLS